MRCMDSSVFAANLERRRERMRQASIATALSVGSLALLAPTEPGLLAPLAITAFICAAAAAWLRDSYLELLEHLATDADAYWIRQQSVSLASGWFRRASVIGSRY